MATTLDLFVDSARVTMHEAREMTADSLVAHAINHEYWVIAWSGGKDSTTTSLTILRQIKTGEVPRPTSMTGLCCTN